MSATNNGNSNGDVIQYVNHDFETAEKERLKVWAFPEDPYESERDGVAILRRNKIYAVYGRWTEWKYTDLVAFGCVRIETKTSTLKIKNGRQKFAWRIAPRNPEKGLRGEIIMLMADYGDRVESALFPTSHEVFYRPDGTLKKGIEYSPQRRKGRNDYRYGLPLTADIWNDHVNNFDLVWSVLYENVEKM